MQGPGAVALKLLRDANCTEEQIDAVALLAYSMQKRFEERPDKDSILLPVSTPKVTTTAPCGSEVAASERPAR